jgi:hypothetical protein
MWSCRFEKRRHRMGLFNFLFGEPSDDQVNDDIKHGSAGVRSSGEAEAQADYYAEKGSSGNDPLSGGVSDWYDGPSPK